MGCSSSQNLNSDNIKLHPDILLKKNMIFTKTDFFKRKTNIVCTLGPASSSVEVIGQLLDAGMGIARLNFSHGDHNSHRKLLTNLRSALAQRPHRSCAVMLDTKGPEIRTGFLQNHTPVEVKKDDIIEITNDYSFLGNSSKIACSYKHINEVPVGNPILIADGSITCEVLEQLSDGLKVKLLNSATVGERKNMNLPGVTVKLPVISEKDVDDIVNFGIKENVDMIAASFVCRDSDVHEIRDVLKKNQGESILIISKIESEDGLKNVEDILKVSDGIMVARGDMGMEIPMEKIFIAQKFMIDAANIAGKPVITATQMLESMIQNPRPTRAETTDIANAVMDGSDCVMLSGETAGGAYPVKAVDIMARICSEAELSINYSKLNELIYEHSKYNVNIQKAAAYELVEKAKNVDAALIVLTTESGYMPRIVSKYRPKQPILAISTSESSVRKTNLLRGALGYFVESLEKDAEVINEAVNYAIERKLIKKGDKVIRMIHTGKDAQFKWHDEILTA